MNADRPKYKLKYRPPPVTRLLHYKSLPPPLMGDPPDRTWRTWEERCVAVYRWMIAEKQQRGLWFHAE